ncbi:hypothetical protein [Magnetospirillum sp. 64-120]|uniref:hypothetical protein n=1 Tax=Magnetospirillum sp. 64-120 TaxID=1895778 RepID=UPI000929A503|nr:hypothetical protein [Magnetospirillum sp. 64-120]OJX79362.1 MAG: hypothetical protein BGO92_12815 [Magnetospirillum sp. 64-120]
MTDHKHKIASIDVELAVALEVGLTRVERAEQLGGMADALVFNRELWRVVGFLADGAKLQRCREELRDTALAVAQGKIDHFALINRRFAGLFAAQPEAYGAMGAMLADWRTFRRNAPKAEFSQWLLDRLESQIEARHLHAA